MKIFLLIIALSFSAMAQLKPNQAIVEANREIRATLFNEALIIEVVEVSKEQTVAAVIHCKDAENVKINNERAGYELNIRQFKIRVQEVKESSAVFFVEKLEAQNIDADAQTYLIDKQRALEIYRGSNLGFGDLVIYQEGANTDGKIAVVLKRRDRESLLDAIEMTGIVSGRKVVPETCFGSRGQDCLVHGKVSR
jgi:hypothetical protein